MGKSGIAPISSTTQYYDNNLSYCNVAVTALEEPSSLLAVTLTAAIPLSGAALVLVLVRLNGTEIWNCPPKGSDWGLPNQITASEEMSRLSWVVEILYWAAGENVKASLVREREVV